MTPRVGIKPVPHWWEESAHRCAIPAPPVHFNVSGHSINDIQLIPLDLIHTNRDSLQNAREAHLIDKAKILEPIGINRRDDEQ